MYPNLDENSAPEAVQRTEEPNDTTGEALASETIHERDAGYENLDELAGPAPEQNPEEGSNYRHSNLEDEREGEDEEKLHGRPPGTDTRWEHSAARSSAGDPDRFIKFKVWSHLVLCSILGTLARLGLQALTRYPGAPIPNTELWANIGGSFVMGFIREDRLLFRKHWANAKIPRESTRTSKEEGSSEPDIKAISESFLAAKATIPAYIGVTVGFCGSFTSFSSFIRDVFLALSNDLNTASISSMIVTSTPEARSGGYSVMAVLGVLIVEITTCLGALSFGAHMATFLHPFADSVSSINMEKYLDVLASILGWGVWIGAIIMAILPPDRFGSTKETWRSQVLFALVFAPVGCFVRFWLSLQLNGKSKSFPLGTFIANTMGTLVLGMCYALQHVTLPGSSRSVGGGLIGCAVLQGIQDGFCGCLTTVSTWALELKGLRTSHAYRYGIVSVGVSFCLLVVIMGTVRWSVGFSAPACKI
ncbi:hypothetical protein AUEXF2481DRAFT_31855 [Aureobasidium subglaciale EXF-2481]|uniref:Uncharacterized protein n=1 Tax=Aureobasidium subglaciale (strain EXF-2481) TaxID=1043005 RepID=A0A074YES5_AURSE|nr:uncharacterized protein AUEXF2481DRAFT_31855 [Aureobasidium subglaciale EXF-2481]KEQ92597.1 hypothetical protein AUEXF2481DRAFT_31855 [Aureobasidium subglaciale EXF-2481]